MPTEKVLAEGHPNVLCLHKTTLEFTKDPDLTLRGDCIFAVSSDKAIADLSPTLLAALKNKDAHLIMTIECGGAIDTVTACGHPDLILSDPHEAVIRKSDFICPRTLAIGADKGAIDLSRELVAALQTVSEVVINIEVIL